MANYYPIKCPYCLKSHTNDTVRFNLDRAFVISEKALKKSLVSYEETESVNNDYVINADWDDTPNEPPAASSGARKQLPTGGYYTLSELKEIFGDSNVKLEEKMVLAMPALTNDQCSGELLTGVTLSITEDGKAIEKAMRERYCDCAEGRKISESAGSIPSYVILLMGSSNAGKTVYLLSLYHALSHKSNFLFPPTKDPEKAIAKLWLSVLSEGMAGTDIETMTDELFLDGKLPGTTTFMTNEPLTMEVTINFNKSGLTNKALLYLRDMPGENFTSRERQQELMKITDQFPKFDGFMIMFDPITFEDSVFPSTNASSQIEQRRQVNQLRQVIQKRITPTMPNNMIGQPTAAIITKGDLFFDRNYMSALKNKGISYASPILTQTHKESFDKVYFDEVDKGTQAIVGKLSGNISELIEANFRNAFFSLVSALSRSPIDIDGEYVTTPAAISPWRVTDPMLRLLMNLHIVPPLDETYTRKTGETQEERTARVFKNRTIINEWGIKYCTGGSSVNLI